MKQNERHYRKRQCNKKFHRKYKQVLQAGMNLLEESEEEAMEVRDNRCCMCPQIDSDRHICPEGGLKKEETACNFAVTWIDGRGWKYKVMGDLAGTFKGRYQDDKHSGGVGWKGMRQMERRKRFDEAQEDLNKYAKQKGWEVWDG